MRPAIRLAAFMHQPTILVFTHDSIGLGEDGPTHQPIEHLSSLRCIPNLTVLRPADSAETVEAWRTALLHKDGPVALVLTRQKLAFIDDAKRAPASELARGGYVLIECPCGKPDLVLMASGSEVGLIVSAQKRLHDEFDLCVRAVSMPSHELFLKQTPEYRESVLPRGIPRIAIEAAHPMSWHRFLSDGDVALGIERFGASAPYQRIFTELGLTVDHLVAEGRRLTGK
jgi:transketolase